MALGARIRLAREGLGWDQADLCQLVEGLSQQALSNLETRDSKTSEFAIRIADALGVSIRWLLDGAGRKEDRDWPFSRVPRTRWDECTDEDRGYIQGAMNRAFDDCMRSRSGEQAAEPLQLISLRSESVYGPSAEDQGLLEGSPTPAPAPGRGKQAATGKPPRRARQP